MEQVKPDMTEEELKQELLDAKRMMKIHKPLAGYMGNQYRYWKEKKETIEKKLNSARSERNELGRTRSSERNELGSTNSKQ